jgi:hypothetical protein
MNTIHRPARLARPPRLLGWRAGLSVLMLAMAGRLRRFHRVYKMNEQLKLDHSKVTSLSRFSDSLRSMFTPLNPKIKHLCITYPKYAPRKNTLNSEGVGKTFEKCSILFKVKEGDDFNRRHTRQVFRGLKSEPDAEIGQKGACFKGLSLYIQMTLMLLFTPHNQRYS